MNAETQPTLRASRPASTFHSDDVESLGEYRTLSVLSLVSLGFGLLSPLCFIAPLSLAFPLISIGLALIALRRIANGEGVLSGRWAAMSALAISVGSLVAMFSYGQTLRLLQVRQAEDVGIKWLTILTSGNTNAAFRLTYDGNQLRSPPPGPGRTPPKDPYESFVESPVIERLSQLSRESQVRFDATSSYESRGGGACVVEQRFEVTPQGGSGSTNGEAVPIRIDLTLQRSVLPDELRPRWLVVAFRDADAPSDTGVDGLVPN